MGQLTRAIDIVRVFFARLTTSQQLLLGSLSVLMVMTLFIVREYTAVNVGSGKAKPPLTA